MAGRQAVDKRFQNRILEHTVLRDAEVRKSQQERVSEAQDLGNRALHENHSRTGEQGQAREETALPQLLNQPSKVSKQRSSKTPTGCDNPPEILQDQIREARFLIEELHNDLRGKSEEIKQLRMELERIQKLQTNSIKDGRFADFGEWETKYKLQSQVLERSEEEKRSIRRELDEAEMRELELRKQLKASDDLEPALVTPGEVDCGGKGRHLEGNPDQNTWCAVKGGMAEMFPGP